ncbi:MAG: molybdenum cofactor biosynthesis protein MoaE [Henriciella sp.]
MITITDLPIHSGDVLRAFETENAAAGAIVTFTGQVRPNSNSGAVSALFLQAYSPMTETGIERAIKTANAKWPLTGVKVVHRVGEMLPGDTIVFVAAASKHRRAAFEAADFLMDYLKTEAVFWKKETVADKATWIEPRAEDYQDAKRWNMEQAQACQE